MQDFRLGQNTNEPGQNMNRPCQNKNEPSQNANKPGQNENIIKTYNNTSYKDLYINSLSFSLSKSEQEEMKQYYAIMEQIKNNIEYKCLIDKYDSTTVDQIVNAIVEVYYSNEIKVTAGYSSAIVKLKFLELRVCHI